MQLVLIIIVFFSLYAVMNAARAIKGRIQADYLRNASRKTALWLLGLQLIVIIIGITTENSHVTSLAFYYVLASAQLAATFLILVAALRNLEASRAPRLGGNYNIHELPALSVCIPARNETEDLEACLKSLLASNYPKLEILVLDDCSQNPRTPEIIRGFAHDGVRFIAGQTPPEDWLAKNFAYDQLAKVANGDLLLFLGVDCRLEPDSLTNMVRLILKEQKSMACILPRNILPDNNGLRTLLVQPARYAWELALPRSYAKRPPVLSSCWLIKRAFLQNAGGFGAVSRKCVPESYFARQAAASGNGYSFVQASSEIGLTSTKAFAEQRATAIRTRYPQLHRRPELVALVTLSEVAVLVWPIIIFLAAALTRQWWLAVISGLAYLISVYVYARMVNLAYRRFVPMGLFVLPLAAVYDICLLNYSMWQYEFGEVIWKGRNVCIPVMRVVASLPKIN